MKTIIIHSKTLKGRWFTLAGIPDGSQMTVGIARCNKKDMFTKKTGRMIAEGRALKNPTATIICPLSESLKDYVNILQKEADLFSNGESIINKTIPEVKKGV